MDVSDRGPVGKAVNWENIARKYGSSCCLHAISRAK